MDFTSIIGSFLTDGGAGALVGGLGAIVGGFFKWLNRKQDAAAAKAERQHIIELHRLNAEKEERENQFELDKVEQQHGNDLEMAHAQGSWAGLTASYNLQLTSEHCSKWVNNIKALMRPFLTVLLVVAAMGQLYWLVNTSQEYVTGLALHELIEFCIKATFNLAATAVMWWFGDRQIQKALTPKQG